MSLDWIKSDQDSGTQQAYNILLPAHSCEWVGFSFSKRRANSQYIAGSPDPAKKTKNIGVISAAFESALYDRTSTPL